MSRYPFYGARIRLAPANGVKCVREGDSKNDVIGCEYGHPRLIDLCIAAGVKEKKGKGKKRIKLKKEVRKILQKSSPALC